MRINIVIDDQLVKKALKLSRYKTEKKLIQEALEEFIKNRKRRDGCRGLCCFEFSKKVRDEFFYRHNLVDTVSILAAEDEAVINIPEVRV